MVPRAFQTRLRLRRTWCADYDPHMSLRHRFGLLSAAAALLAVALATAALAHTTAASSVVLGNKAFAPQGTGFGKVRPSKIFNGGDPSGLVSSIHWKSWGGSKAIGFGKGSIFKPKGGYYHKLVTIELRAQSLGKCTSTGPTAYTKLYFRAPSHPGGKLGKWKLWSLAKSICHLPGG